MQDQDITLQTDPNEAEYEDEFEEEVFIIPASFAQQSRHVPGVDRSQTEGHRRRACRSGDALLLSRAYAGTGERAIDDAV